MKHSHAQRQCTLYTRSLISVFKGVEVVFLKRFLFIYLFSERGEGREKERERNINV